MDTFLKNGKIYLGEGRFASSLLIRDGLVAGVDCTPDGAREVDLGGRTVVPGFIDSHLHMFNTGRALRSVKLHGVDSIRECIALGRRFIEEQQPGPGAVIVGRGWNDDYFLDEHRMLDRHDLDQVSTDRPVIYTRACGHALACNTKALELAGVTADTAQPEGGRFELGDDGAPNGIFKEHAMGMIQKLIADPDLEEAKAILQAAMAHASENGITSVQTNDLSEQNWPLLWEAYEGLRKEGKATVRSYQQCLFTTAEGYEDFIKKGFRTGFGDEMNKIGPLKLLIDGSLGARTSLMRQEFHDMPGNKGIQVVPDALLDRFMAISRENDMQVAVHAIGDRGIELVLDAYQKALPEGCGERRWGIVHCQITDGPLVQRFAEQQVVAMVQPIFLHYDLHMVADRVGDALASTSYAFGTMDKLSIRNCYGTDSPVEDLNTMNNLYCAVTRRDLTGFPENGWYPTECVPVQTAVDHYTADGAWNSFEETKKGKLLPGYYADLAVLDTDIFTCDPMAIKDAKVLMTMLGGKVVFER